MIAIEFLALVVILLSAVKIGVILIKPGAWGKVVNFVYGNQFWTSLVSLVLIVVIGHFLINSGITFIQIFAVIAFIMPVMALSFSVYKKEFLPFAQKLLKDRKILKKSWLPILAWIILMALALREFFGVLVHKRLVILL